jgi:outer membrane protein assembly factor BamB
VPVAIDSRIGTPLVSGEVAYFGTEDGTVYAMDMHTGHELWRFETEGPTWHEPVIHDEVLLFGSVDGRLRAVSAQTGELLWEFVAGQVDWEVRDIFINGKPTVIDGIAYFSSEDFNVYAVEVETGTEIWRHRLGEEPQARSIPIFDGVAYIGAWDGLLYAIDVKSGKERWRSRTDFRKQLSNQVLFVTVVPIITDDAVYFTDWAGNLMAVDIKTGQQIWMFNPTTVDMRHVGSRSYLAMHDDILYYATLEDRHLYGVDRHSGKKVWEFEGDGYLYGPLPAGDGVALYSEYFPATDQRPEAYLVRALDLNTKEILWTADDFSSPPSIHGSIVYHGGKDGTVHGRDLRSGSEVRRLGVSPADPAK